MKRLSVLLSAVALAIPVASNAATAFAFDPDGTGSLSALSLISLDPAAGSALSVGGNPVGGVNDTTKAGPYKLLYQANMGSGILNNASNSPVSLGANFTVVLGFQETVTSATNNATTSTVTFDFFGNDALSADNFFYIYKNTTGANLAGTGFATNPADIILKGHVSSVDASNFTLNTKIKTGACTGGSSVTVRPLDCSGNNDWAGTQTLVGGGSTNLNLTIDWTNTDYFPDLSIGASQVFGFVNSSLVDPFSQVDPSKKFSSDGLANGDVIANIAPINGFNGSTTGQAYDFIFQADANLSLDKTVPEPASLALIGLALGVAGFAGRRRQSK